MIRINLLPPEILEKRKAESRRLYLVAIGLSVLALLGLVWAFMAVQTQIKSAEVASVQQQAFSLGTQAAQFKVFEDRTNELQRRDAVATKALGGRIDWSRLMSDVALVLPSQLWLDNFTGTQAVGQGATPSGQAPNPAAGATATGKATLNLGGWSLYSSNPQDGGFKPLAKLLVRLDGLSQLDNVWLQSGEFREQGYKQQDAISWTTVSDVVVPGSATATASAIPGKP